MSIPLRDYQQEALEAVLNEAKAGIKRQLITLPTGSGKTIVMSAIAKKLDKKTLVIAHREELIKQAHDKFKLFWPSIDVGICQAERDEINNQVVIGSVQSCSRPKRLKRIKELGFKVLMIDEAHHAASDSYQSLINELGFRNDSEKLLIGVTATPQRNDNLGLGSTFEKITYYRSIATMIRAGYLSPVSGRKILTRFNLKGIKIRNGDFSIGELSESINTPERNFFVVEKFKAYATDRKAIAFCADVKHCKDLADVFCKHGIKAKAVWGDMPADERESTLEDLKKGVIKVATSCGVLTEGFDEPTIDAIIMARPTRSQGLYIQCVGRGLRLWPGKQNCLVLDFSDQNNDLDGIMSLFATIPEASCIEERPEFEHQQQFEHKPKIEVIQERDEEFDILATSRFIWVEVEGEWSLQDDERNEIVMTPSCSGYVATFYSIEGSSRKIVSSPLPIEYCSGICEDFARQYLKVLFADLTTPWMNSSNNPTPGQIEYLQKQQAYREGITKAEAAIEIRKIVARKNRKRRQLDQEPITAAQKYFLTGQGINTANMTKFQAI